MKEFIHPHVRRGEEPDQMRESFGCNLGRQGNDRGTTEEWQRKKDSPRDGRVTVWDGKSGMAILERDDRQGREGRGTASSATREGQSSARKGQSSMAVRDEAMDGGRRTQ